MKRYEVDKVRSVALVGPGGAGKTSFGEALLFTAGATTRLGRVDDGSSLFDYEPEEKRHDHTISSSFASAEYRKHRINLADTPGYDVFLYDAQATARASDGVVLVVSAEPEVKFETEKLWQTCDEYGLPRAVVINRLDKDNARFDTTLEALRKTFDLPLVPLHLPMGQDNDFRGYVDLLKMKAFEFSDTSGEGSATAIPEDLLDAARAARESLLEHLVETDDTLMEKYFDGQEIDDAELSLALKAGVVGVLFAPVLVGSAAKNIGASAVLDLVVDAFPSPADRGAVAGTGAEGEDETREPTEDAPMSALVFKTISDPFAGRLSVCRVMSGTLRADSHVWNAVQESEERVGQVLALTGKDTEQVEAAGPGDVVALPKLKDTHAGDTLCAKGVPILYSPAPAPEPLITFAAYAKKRGEEDKMMQGFRKMQEEDPTLHIRREEQTHETLVSGMGRLHIDIVCERMKRKYGGDADLRIPKVPYRETLKGSAKIQARHKKQTGGRGQFADVSVKIQPRPSGEGYLYVDKIVGGSIPRQYIPAVDAGVRERMAKGVLAGYPVVDVEVTVFDGKYHDVDSSEMAFKIAGSLAFKKGAQACKPVLLEPIYALTVTVPDDHLGDVIGDLNSRRGRVLGMDPRGGVQVIKAQVPLVEVQEYAPDLRSMTAGRGVYTMQFDHYAEVPANLTEKIVAASQLEDDEE